MASELFGPSLRHRPADVSVGSIGSHRDGSGQLGFWRAFSERSGEVGSTFSAP